MYCSAVAQAVLYLIFVADRIARCELVFLLKLGLLRSSATRKKSLGHAWFLNRISDEDPPADRLRRSEEKMARATIEVALFVWNGF